MNARTDAFLALNLLSGIGPMRAQTLLKHFEGDPEAIFAASVSDLKRVKGVGTELASSILDWENRIDLLEEKRRLDEHGVSLLTIDSEDYPPALRKIYDPPFLLYMKGSILPADRHAIALVGSRRTTHYGTEAARRFGFQLANAGITIVSGLARGIDTAGHEAALAAGGRTIAVLGSGIGNVYPAENQGLADKIAENGAVLSEFPVLYVPDKQSFPLRNRIVSGMSQGVLVAEAPERSGSMITAGQAMEQGRVVFAVPGPIDRPSSAGCHRLIQQGAKLVCDAADILSEIDSFSELNKDDAASEDPGSSRLDSLGPTEKQVLAAFGNEKEMLVDNLVEAAGLPLATVNVALLQLEMNMVIKQLPGKIFSKLL
ncbi:DNA-processing protein DprA [Verrucomicrobiales bacterium]|nr:DNA-processing protein DprA [Verrucomicrobiales bacterium]